MFLELVHSLLTRIPPEAAHDLGLQLLRLTPRMADLDDEALYLDVKFGRLKNPVGLAAGFDKTGRHIASLERLGFGYMVVGTATMNPRKGLKKPRIVRRKEEQALVNAMAFPNPGLRKFIQNISRNNGVKTPVLVSLSDENEQNLVKCYAEVQPHAAGVEINLSSPNTPPLRSYFQPERFKQTAEELRHHKQKPTYLKIPPPLTRDEQEAVYRAVKIWHDAGFDGITAVNAMLVDEPRVSAGRGGLSGKPLYRHMLKTVKEVRNMFREEFEIHAVGGIFTGYDVLETLASGADTVQIHTALAYRGPKAVRHIVSELRQAMAERSLFSLKSLPHL
ncbi:MAG: dihydroorotate dehydrogenase 2 [Candidatus Caldarchaeum sp.]